MIKKALLALGLLLATGVPSYSQTAGQSVMGFLLAQGSTYNGYTCPSTATSPCFVQYGSSLPTGGGGGSSNVTVTGPLGSQTSPNGVSVTIASDQAAVAVKQTTAANLNATVVGTGTFATQSTLQAGSAIAGKFGIDQTTPG